MGRAPRLSGRYKAFADTYLSNGCNAVAAAKAAGYSDSYAKSSSYLLLQREDVVAYIKYRRRQLIEATVSPEQVILELADIGFGRKEYPTYTILGDREDRLPSVGNRTKALELVGKAVGVFDKQQAADDQMEKARELLGGIKSAID